MSLLFDIKPIDTVDDAVHLYDDGGLASPTRSTVPLLSWLKHERPMVDFVLRKVGMPALCNLHLEYKVKPQKGRGKASHTDLMVISGKSSLAIEAKWTEPRYDTISRWLNRKGLNAQNVLDGWLGLLQEYAQCPLQQAAFSNAVYQVVHRAASACKAGKIPTLAYLVFKSSRDPKTADIQTIRDDLTRLSCLLGSPEQFPFYLVEVQLTPTDAFAAIASLPKGKEATEQQVRAALHGSDPLFSFEKPCVTRVGD
jgi:hypothetical protein